MRQHHPKSNGCAFAALLVFSVGCSLFAFLLTALALEMAGRAIATIELALR